MSSLNHSTRVPLMVHSLPPDCVDASCSQGMSLYDMLKDVAIKAEDEDSSQEHQMIPMSPFNQSGTADFPRSNQLVETGSCASSDTENEISHNIQPTTEFRLLRRTKSEDGNKEPSSTVRDASSIESDFKSKQFKVKDEVDTPTDSPQRQQALTSKRDSASLKVVIGYNEVKIEDDTVQPSNKSNFPLSPQDPCVGFDYAHAKSASFDWTNRASETESQIRESFQQMAPFYHKQAISNITPRSGVSTPPLVTDSNSGTTAVIDAHTLGAAPSIPCLDGKSRGNDDAEGSCRRYQRWIESEDRLLMYGLELKHSARHNWDWISKELFKGQRTATQCKARWKNALCPEVNRGAFTPKEDESILHYQNLGCSWPEIASHLPGRIPEQVRERFVNQIDPNRKASRWTDEEDNLLTVYQAKHGNRWTYISKLMPGRSENDIKNRWHNRKTRQRRAMRRMLTKMKKPANQIAECARSKQTKTRAERRSDVTCNATVTLTLELDGLGTGFLTEV